MSVVATREGLCQFVHVVDDKSLMCGIEIIDPIR